MKKITLIIMILGMITISNAQIEKIELKLTPEIEEMVVAQIKNLPEEWYSDWGIKDKSQLENLHTGKPIPWYMVINEKLEFVSTQTVSRMSDGDTLSLKFTNTWNVPVMSDKEPLLFGLITPSDFGDPYISYGIKNTIEHFHNYEHKDSVIGSVGVNGLNRGMDYLIIRKDNKDVFVQIYDEATGEYFKNEYNFSELINHVKALGLREKEAQMRYYEKVANKSELEITPEITEILNNSTFFSGLSDESLSDLGIKNRTQLENLYFGKPIPIYYVIDNESLIFSGRWQVPVMSDGDPLFMTSVKLEDDGQYRWTGSGRSWAETIHNYEHKDLIIGLLYISRGPCLIIQKDNKDIFVQMYDFNTREYFKNEYSFSELLNLLKK